MLQTIFGRSLACDRKDEIRYGYLTVLLFNFAIWPGHFSMSIALFFKVLFCFGFLSPKICGLCLQFNVENLFAGDKKRVQQKLFAGGRKRVQHEYPWQKLGQ